MSGDTVVQVEPQSAETDSQGETKSVLKWNEFSDLTKTIGAGFLGIACFAILILVAVFGVGVKDIPPPSPEITTLSDPKILSLKLTKQNEFLRLSNNDTNEDQAVTHFREYLQIKTDLPNPDYGKLRFLSFEVSNFKLSLSKLRPI